MKLTGLIFRLTMSFVLMAPLGLNAAQSDFAALLDQARKEDGKLSYGTDVDRKMMQPILDAFKKDFPFVKSIDYRLNRADEVRASLMELTAGGKTDLDLATISDEFLKQYLSMGWVRKPPIAYEKLVDSLPLDWPKPRQVQFHPQGFTIAAAGYLRGIAYNNKVIPRANAPMGWEDCVNPKWKGRVMYDPRLKLGGFMMYKKQWFTEWLKKLAANNVVLGRGQTANLEMISTGEHLIFCGVNYRSTMEMIDRGVTTLSFVLPNPYAYNLALDGYILRDSPRPYSAELFSIWLGTKGLTLVEKYIYDGFTWLPGARLHEAAQGKEGVVCDLKCSLMGAELSEEHNRLLGIPVAK